MKSMRRRVLWMLMAAVAAPAGYWGFSQAVTAQVATAPATTRTAATFPFDPKDIMPGFEQRPFRSNPERLRKRREEYPLTMCRHLVVEMAARTAESRKLFPHKFFRGDCHSHTDHSDGGGTVAETAAMVKAAQLDFQFVTDHWGTTQAAECREHGLWVGQEPATKHHHLGILGLKHAFVPQRDFLKDVADAKTVGTAVFIPHPAGWYPRDQYKEEQLKIMEQLPAPFMMEIANGASNIVTAFDYTDEAAIALWDHLLSMGKVVHAMGNTDAHVPHCIGIVWNSVYAEKCEQDEIVRELSAGHSFVSDGPLLHIGLGKARMGDRATAEDRGGELEITAVDVKGLAWVKVVVDGKQADAWWCRSEAKFTKTMAVPAGAAKYVRVEVRSDDGRRAYSNPIYLSARP
jgi:predicted metal-dependent phosphoesterase TrpH